MRRPLRRRLVRRALCRGPGIQHRHAGQAGGFASAHGGNALRAIGPKDKPRIVGYDAKWEEDSAGWRHTVRRFGVEQDEPRAGGKTCDRLANRSGGCSASPALCGWISGCDDDGAPLILEINANPCISPDAGFAAAAEEAGMSYDDLIEAIVQAAQ